MPTESPVRAKELKRAPREERESPQQVARIPGHVPSSLLTEERREELKRFLKSEFARAEGERQDFINKIARWKVAYRAPLQTEPKHFPIFNASNLVIPVIKEAVNTIAAQLVQATMTARPRWVFQDLSTEWEPFLDEIERFMDLASDRDMELDKTAVPWIIETAKLGTGIVEHGYDLDVRRVYRYTADGKKVYPKEVVMSDGPAVSHIPLDKFWIRFTESDIQKAKWVATELNLTEHQLRTMERKGKIHSVDKILNIPSDGETPATEAQERIENTEPIDRMKYKIYRVWVSWDLDGQGPVELKLYYHRGTDTICGEFFNPFDHGKRPFVKIGYFPVEDRFYDEGLCEMLEQIQEAISSMANRRADNATLANLKMIIKKKMTQGLKPGDPLYSGKVIETQDPFRDIREFSLSDIYPSTVTEEQFLQKRGERLAGVNEGIVGAAMPVSRTTASAQLALLQEQAKRIDLTIRSIRKGFNEIGQAGLDMYFQFGTGGKAQAWLGEKGKIVDAVFSIPRARLELGYGIKAQTPTSLQNRQVKRENKIQLFNLLVQAHKELIPFAQAFAPDELPRLAQAMVAASRKYLSDVLETFEETDPEAVLAGLAVLERILPRPEDLGGLESLERRTASSETLEAISRLEGSLREAEGSRDGLDELRAQRGNGGRVPPQEGVSGGNLPSDGFLPESFFGEGGG